MAPGTSLRLSSSLPSSACACEKSGARRVAVRNASIASVPASSSGAAPERRSAMPSA